MTVARVPAPRRPPITLRGDDVRHIRLHKRDAGQVPTVEVLLEGDELFFFDLHFLDVVTKTAMRLCGLPPGTSL